MKKFLEPFKEAKIQKGEEEWYVRFEYMDPQTGKWKMFKDRGGLNYKDMRKAPAQRLAFARELCRSYNERLRSGWSPFGEVPNTGPQFDNMRYKPAGEVLDEIVAIKKGSIKKRSWQAYSYSLNIFKKWLTQEKMDKSLIEFITPLVMTKFFDYLRLSGNYKNRSINGHARNLKIIFNGAIERELIAKNPLKKYRKLPQEEGKNYPYSPKQKEQLKAAMLEHDPELWFFAKCIYHLFIRESELLGVRIIDINLQTKNMVVHSVIGKTKRQLSAEIPDSFLEEMKALKLQQYPDEWYLFGRGLKPGPNSYTRNSVSARYKLIKNKCGIADPNYTLYSWKHTGNVDSFLAGVGIFDLMRQNRHQNIAQTQTYLRSMGLGPNIGYSSKAPGI